MGQRLIIRGGVQGVGYRQWFRRKAEDLGLSGTVVNLTDGSVEAIVIGQAAAIDVLVRAAMEGPPLAKVDAILREELGADDTRLGLRGFAILPSAS